MSRYKSARELDAIIGEATGDDIATEYATTFLAPTRADPDAPMRCVAYLEGGPPGRRVVSPPDYVIDVDAIEGRVIRVARCTPEELGIPTPPPLIPGAGINPGMPVDEFWRRRDRVLDLSSTVWGQFTDGAARTPEASELLATILTVTRLDVAPFQVLPTHAFFRWMGL